MLLAHNISYQAQYDKIVALKCQIVNRSGHHMMIRTWEIGNLQW